jgi:hypothetical protein
MRVSARLTSLAVRALAESMDVHTMIQLSRRLIQNYDLFARTGFPRNISIPNKDAARQIVGDIKDEELFLDFIIHLIRIRESGFRGRKYRIPYLRDILIEINNSGLVYDKEQMKFFEDSSIITTKNWGVLREQEEYIFTFLRLDIVQSSRFVRNHNPEEVEKTYSDIRHMVQEACEKRNGRIWNWEGDGVLVAFHFSGRNTNAVLSAMEILHGLYVYNLMRGGAEDAVRVRMAVDSGYCEFRHRFDEIDNDTLKKLEAVESYSTNPDSVTVSSNVYMYLDHLIVDQLVRLTEYSNPAYYSYELRWER